MSANLIKEMKDRIARSGASKKEIIYFGKDSTKRIRFIQELDTGYKFEFHSNWDPSIFTLCRDPEDHEDCELCKDGIALQENYVWSVWDYDSSSVKLICTKANGISPIPAFIEMYEEFGTIMDRDYKVKKVGSGMGGSFIITPLDKERFKNHKAKPYTEKQIIEILKKAFPYDDKQNEDDEDEGDEDEDEKEDRRSKKEKGSRKKKAAKKTVREKYEELDWEEVKQICSEIGVSKKVIRGFEEDVDEAIDYLFDEYEEEDLEEMLEDLENEDDEDE